MRKVRRVLWVGVSALLCAAVLLSGCAKFDGVVDFTADPTSGKKPLSVRFTPQVSGNPERWVWSFGDGQTSAERTPEHTYAEAGAYTVILMVVPCRGEAASAVKEDYIMVRSGFGSAPPTLVVLDDQFNLDDQASVPVVANPWGGTAYVLDVLANDTAGTGAAGLTIVGVRSAWDEQYDPVMAEAGGGVAWISADGTTIEYEPFSWMGNLFSDSFYYLVSDGQTTAEGEVSVECYFPYGHP